MANSVEMKVSGMTCGHCEMHVKQEVGALEGVKDVQVELEPNGVSTVKVALDGEVSDEALREAVDEAGGYSVEAISR